MSVHVERVTGARRHEVLPVLARLRIEVFRDFPYLYDGSLAYEETYLAQFARSDRAVIVVASDGAEIVGAATGAPMAEHAPEFAEPFRARGHDVERIFYFGESVLRSSYRGQGIGHAFFDEREAGAKALGGFTHCAFCAVVRPQDHPLRPKDYRPLDEFWTKRGYRKIDGLVAQYSWKDINRAEADEKPMQFWIRALTD